MECFCSAVSDSGRPEAGVLERLLGVGVPRDLDLDHPVDVVVVAPGLVEALVDRGHELVAVELLALAGGADEAVAVPAGVPRDHRTPGGDVHRHRRVGAVVDRGVLGAVVLALEGDAVLGPQPAHQRRPPRAAGRTAP